MVVGGVVAACALVWCHIFAHAGVHCPFKSTPLLLCCARMNSVDPHLRLQPLIVVV